MKNFLAEAPLAPSARDVLLDAFDQGWHDPQKLTQGASKARALRQNSLESIAAGLGVHPTEIEVLGEPSLGHFLTIQGFIQPTSTIFYSSVDKKEIQAIARAWQSAVELPVDSSGQINPDALREAKADDLFALQGANAETGVVQNLGKLTERFLSQSKNGSICLDFTAVGCHQSLPATWDGAIFDSRSWRGPQGLGIVAIKNGSKWRNPLPHINSVKTPQSFSLPLLISSAVALESWTSDAERLRGLSRRLRDGIRSGISDCDIAGELEGSLPHVNSFSFLYVEGEELLRSLEKRGFLVDSGSACTAEDLQPSHVLAAMGILTHGNVRVTIHTETTEADIEELIGALVQSVEELRKQ
ncbi:MAG: aminotransferase class V-fold PLP-dependent enzyme [Actinobacteria bacterium]|nr:aminotransferase class V-fold PLP-dependent enzyme [Actinomycetota bacterium]